MDVIGPIASRETQKWVVAVAMPACAATVRNMGWTPHWARSMRSETETSRSRSFLKSFNRHPPLSVLCLLLSAYTPSSPFQFSLRVSTSSTTFTLTTFLTIYPSFDYALSQQPKVLQRPAPRTSTKHTKYPIMVSSTDGNGCLREQTSRGRQAKTDERQTRVRSRTTPTGRESRRGGTGTTCQRRRTLGNQHPPEELQNSGEELPTSIENNNKLGRPQRQKQIATGTPQQRHSPCY